MNAKHAKAVCVCVAQLELEHTTDSYNKESHAEQSCPPVPLVQIVFIWVPLEVKSIDALPGVKRMAVLNMAPGLQGQDTL